MKAILSALAVLASLPVLGGYLGALHPLGDSLAVFRLQAAGLLAVMSAFALMAGAVRWGRIGMLMGLLAGVPVVWAYGTTPAPGGDLRLYQKNMLYRNDALPDLAADIRAAAPDAVTLQEVSQANLALLNDLAPDFPHQLRCDEPGAGGGAVLTRLMPVPGGEFCAPGLAAMQVQGPKGPLWLVSIHLRWTWPHNQAAQVQALVPVLAGLQGPVVMAGDFNGALVLGVFRAGRCRPHQGRRAGLRQLYRLCPLAGAADRPCDRPRRRPGHGPRRSWLRSPWPFGRSGALAQKAGIERIAGQVLAAGFGDQHLILQLDRECAALG